MLSLPFPVSTRFLAVLVLLLLAAGRLWTLRTLPLDYDEAWTVWLTMGSLPEVLERVPFDWPPLYFVLLWAWQQIVGSDPLTMRLLSVLFFLPGCVFTYRAALRIFHNERAALLAMLASAATGYSIYLSIYLRGYTLFMLWFPLALWLLLRYFDRPAIRRVLPLALVMTAMFYTNLTAVMAFVMLGLCTLLLYPRRLWRWVPVGLFVLPLALPEIAAKAGLAANRHVGTFGLGPYPQAISSLYQDYAGAGFPVWLLMAPLALLLLLLVRPARLRLAVLLGIWVLVMPSLLYLLDSLLGLFLPSYSWWVLPGIGLLVGGGLALLLPYPRAGAGMLLVLLAFLPVAGWGYGIPGPAFEPNMRLLAQELRPGDVVLIDPNCPCGAPVEWDYHTGVFFPQGLHFVAQPGQQRRIWHVHASQRETPGIYNVLERDYLRSKFFGPWDFLFRLYEAPPDRAGVPFDNGMRFHGAEFVAGGQPVHPPVVYREGEQMTLRLWWSADEVPAGDYSVGVYIMDGTGLVMQDDSGPQLVHLEELATEALPEQTSGWQPGHYYIEQRTLRLPNPLPTGRYSVYLVVYQWWDNLRFGAPGVTEDTLLPAAAFDVLSW